MLTPLSRLSVAVPEAEMHEEESPMIRIPPRAIDSDFQQLMKLKAYRPGRRLAPLNVALSPLPEISMTPLLREAAESPLPLVHDFSYKQSYTSG